MWLFYEYGGSDAMIHSINAGDAVKDPEKDQAE
jgi:hypothetical protein